MDLVPFYFATIVPIEYSQVKRQGNSTVGRHRVCLMRCYLVMILFSLLLVQFVHQAQASASASAKADDTMYLASPGNGPGERLAQSVLLGLLNKHLARPAVAFNIIPTDMDWLDSYKSDNPAQTFTNVNYQELAEMAVQSGAVRASILYAIDETWSYNAAVTLAGVQNAVPIPADGRGNASVVPNILSTLPVTLYMNGMFKDELEAAAWSWVNLYPACTDTDKRIAIQAPNLLQGGLLSDLIVQRNIFSFWLPDMCTPGSKSQAWYWQFIAAAHDNGNLLDILGYFPSQEVVAACSPHHTEITLVSDWNSGLSFWSQMPPIGAQLQQPQAHTLTYDPSKTYVAVIASDGDNMQMDFNADRNLMVVRTAMCQVVPEQCPPLSWTLSNRLADYAPYQLQWYFRQAAATGKDSFLMGPSGYGFLHPSLIDAQDPLAAQLVNDTLAAGGLMQAQGFVLWDEYNNKATMGRKGSREPSRQGPSSPMDAVYRGPRQPSNTAGMRAYLSRFQGSGMGVFTPVTPSIAGFVGDVPVFQEWIRWFGKDDPMDVAEMLGHPDLIGSLGYVYKILDVPTQSLGDLVAGLAEHVQLVGYRELIDLARQKQAAQADSMQADEEEDAYYQEYQEYSYPADRAQGSEGTARTISPAQAGSSEQPVAAKGAMAGTGTSPEPALASRAKPSAGRGGGVGERSVIAALAAYEMTREIQGTSR